MTVVSPVVTLPVPGLSTSLGAPRLSGTPGRFERPRDWPSSFLLRELEEDGFVGHLFIVFGTILARMGDTDL